MKTAEMTNQELRDAYRNGTNADAGKMAALVEMARRVRMLPNFYASIGKSEAFRRDTATGIYAVFCEAKLTTEAAGLCW